MSKIAENALVYESPATVYKKARRIAWSEGVRCDLTFVSRRRVGQKFSAISTRYGARVVNKELVPI